MLQQVVESTVRFFGRPEARILSHSPEPPAIHVAVDSPGEGIFTRPFRSPDTGFDRRVVSELLFHIPVEPFLIPGTGRVERRSQDGPSLRPKGEVQLDSSSEVS